MFRALVLAAAVVILSGCVWSRLLDWKAQLKDFDRYIDAVVDGPALVFKFKEPCIRPADIGYLLGGDQPSRTTPRADGGIIVTWQMRRDRADSIGLELNLGAADGKEETLADSLIIPPQVLAFIPVERVLAMARAFGSADIDRNKRQAAAGFSGPDSKPLTPGRQTIVAAFGEPDSDDVSDDREIMTYRFKLVAPDGTLGKPSDMIIELHGEQLISARLKAPNFNAWMKFAD
jgi:hypothetical protein